MFGLHFDIPRIPGRPLGCCKVCRQEARHAISRKSTEVCPRCGLARNMLPELLNIKQFLVFEDSQGNIILRVRNR